MRRTVAILTSLTLMAGCQARTGTPAPPVEQPHAAAALAAKLHRPARFLVGLGGQGTADALAAIKAQGLKPDIFEVYLVGAGGGDWTEWNSPKGAYIHMVTDKAEAVGAIPMFTVYMMATNGDGNLKPLRYQPFMDNYWANLRLMFQQIAHYGKPVLVNVEPDFWGYAQRQASGGDPTRLEAFVNHAPECTDLPNDITGIGGCVLRMRARYAPNAFIGFPPSEWGADTITGVVRFMNQIGAAQADFIVAQTSDRDTGCIEVHAKSGACLRDEVGHYWDTLNEAHPNFHDHLGNVLAMHEGIGGLPVIWWQTPLGAPSHTPGGTDFHYRDNRALYFLTHVSELTAVGGLGAVFGAGEDHQTNITTDDGEFRALDIAYLASPVPLP